MFLGLPASAWVIVLQAMMTAASILSAWSFAMPVVRSQGLDFSISTLRDVQTDDAEIQALVHSAIEKLDSRRERKMPGIIRSNNAGVIWLGVSVLLFLGALGLQIHTDRAFSASP